MAKVYLVVRNADSYPVKAVHATRAAALADADRRRRSFGGMGGGSYEVEAWRVQHDDDSAAEEE